MRISDWSSDVCSSDLARRGARAESSVRSRAKPGVIVAEAGSVAHGACGEHGRMLADVMGPVDHGVLEARQVGCEQRTRGFLEAGCIAGDGMHEAVGRFLALAPLVAAAVTEIGR